MIHPGEKLNFFLGCQVSNIQMSRIFLCKLYCKLCTFDASLTISNHWVQLRSSTLSIHCFVFSKVVADDLFVLTVSRNWQTRITEKLFNGIFVIYEHITR